MIAARRLLVPLLLLLLPLAPAGAAETADEPELDLVSRGAAGQSRGQSWDPSVSADGSVVAFFSGGDDLVPGDTNRTGDIFVRDRRTGEVTRVSVATGGAQADGTSGSPHVSGDGTRVTFWSRATNLVPGDTNGQDDVFVHDLTTGTTRRVSVGSTGVQADARSHDPVLSGDGTTVAFTSLARTLAPVQHSRPRVYVHDLQSGRTELVSREELGSAVRPSLDATGRRVAYTQFEDLAPSGQGLQVDVHDRATGSWTRASRPLDGAAHTGSARDGVLSADGRWVAFVSDASTLVRGDTNERTDAFLHDLDTGATTRVSVRSDGEQAAGSTAHDNRNPSVGVSGDGRYVVMLSASPDLVPGDTNTCGSVSEPGYCPDVLVHDRLAGTTTRHNALRDGTQADGTSGGVEISADGSTLVWHTQATSLVPEDRNGWFEDVLASAVSRFSGPRPTVLTAVEGIGATPGSTPHPTRLRAVLTSAESGEGVAGRLVAFSAGGTVACTGTTDQAGAAECAAPTHLPGLLLEGAFEAAFAGDPAWSPSSDRAAWPAALPERAAP